MSRKLREDYKNKEKIIFKAAAQLLGEQSSEAKAAFKKILEEPSKNLKNLKDYIHDLEKSAPLLSHKTFFKIHDNTSLANNSIFKAAKIIRQDAGNRSIQPNLEKELEKHGKIMKDFFSVTKMDMKTNEKVNPSLEV